MTIDEIKRQIFIDSEEVCGNTMIDIYQAEEYVEQAYNKAIDDLIAECENAKFAESDEISLSDVHTGVNSGLSMAIHFAEQLKAVENNEYRSRKVCRLSN